MCDWKCKSQHGCVIGHASLGSVQACPDSAVQTCPNSINAALATFEWASLQSGSSTYRYLPLAAHHTHEFYLCSLCSPLQVHPTLAEFACACSVDALGCSIASNPGPMGQDLHRQSLCRHQIRRPTATIHPKQPARTCNRSVPWDPPLDPPLDPPIRPPTLQAAESGPQESVTMSHIHETTYGSE